jgi:hypothetical protein
MPGGKVTPKAVNEREWLDFHLYQSSHTGDLARPAHQAEACREPEPERPVINGEPPYEGHGLFDEGADERITRELARRAAWISVLAGANAGVTYGGHGLWQWHRRSETNLQAASKGQPDDWEEAMELPGARDYVRLRSFFEEFDYGALEPRQDLLAGEDPRVRAAELPTESVVLAYTPHANEIVFAEDDALADRTVEWRHPGTLERAEAEVDGVRVEAPPFLDDGLLLAR